MAIDEAGIADLALDFARLMDGSTPELRRLLNNVPIAADQSAEFYEGGLEIMVAVSMFLEHQLKKGPIDSKFVLTTLGAFAARCAELLIDARLRNA